MLFLAMTNVHCPDPFSIAGIVFRVNLALIVAIFSAVHSFAAMSDSMVAFWPLTDYISAVDLRSYPVNDRPFLSTNSVTGTNTPSYQSGNRLGPGDGVTGSTRLYATNVLWTTLTNYANQLTTNNTFWSLNFKMNQVAGDQYIWQVHKWFDPLSEARCIEVWYDSSTNRIRMDAIEDSSGDVYTIYATNIGVPEVDEWYQFQITTTPGLGPDLTDILAAGTVSFRVIHLTDMTVQNPQLPVWQTRSFDYGVNRYFHNMLIGFWHNGNYFNGQVAGLGIWYRSLDYAEQLQLARGDMRQWWPRTMTINYAASPNVNLR
jgi:hypothetical protein